MPKGQNDMSRVERALRHRILTAVSLAVWWSLVLTTTALKAQAPPVTGGGYSAATPLPRDVEAGIDARRAQLLEWSRYADANHELKYIAYDILAATARDGCGPPERAEALAHLGDMGITDKTEPVHFEMFSLPPLVRYLYMYGHCMNEAQKAYLVKGLSETPRGIFGPHGTLNHMIMQTSSWYLLAQYFPDTVWTDLEGKKLTSAEVMAGTKALFARRDWRFFQSSHGEMLSTTYSLTNLFPLLDLVDFAKDREVAQQAGSEAALEVLLLKAHSFHGVIIPEITRRNDDQTNAPLPDGWPSFPSIAQHELWFYFGEPKTGRYDFFDSKTREPFYIIMLALSSWRPPAAAFSMPTAEYSVKYVTPDFSMWDGPVKPVGFSDAYIGKSYALATGNMIFNPKGYNDHNETFALVWRSNARRNMLECQQPYWKSNEGENAWAMDLWSPFVESYRIDKNSAVLLANIPKKDPWTVDVEDRFWIERDKHKDSLIQMVQCRIPKSVDQLILDGRWAFFRSGSTFMALESLNGPFENPKEGLPPDLDADFNILKVRKANAALFVMADDSGGSFEKFQSRARAAAPSYDESTSTVSSIAANGKHVSVRFITPSPEPERPGYFRSLPEVKVDGKILTYEPSPVYETPFLKLADGVLRVDGPDSIELRGPPKP
jgi:hypothetical protein